MWKKIKSAQEQKNTFRIKKELWIPVFVLMIGLVVLVNIGIRADSSQRDLIRSRAELNAVTYADHMKADIVRGIDITNTFEQIVISENGKISMFSKVAENMMADYVQSIQIAPDGVVTEIYPEDGNKAGKIDLIHDKERGKISCYARDNDVITMQGPFSLKQGGTGIAIRNPVYLEQKNGERTFWGFTIVIIRVPDIFADSIKSLTDFSYEYKLSKSIAPWDETYEEVYGSGVEMIDPVTYTFELGDSQWVLEVMPENGWNSNEKLYRLWGYGLLIVLLLTGFAFAIILLRRTQESENTVSELNKKLHKALIAAETANRAKSTFLLNMSHDIRTPLNGIMGLLKINMAHSDDEELVRENYKEMEKAANHMLSLINDVLQMSKLEDGREELSLELVCLPDVFCDMKAIIDGSALDKGISVDFSEDSIWVHPYVITNPLYLRQIFLNIYGNGIKFTNFGGKISTKQECIEEKDNVITYRWIISDTGIGMSKEFLKHIFEPFAQERADARSNYHGTGLGMAIVKKMIDKMGGTVSVTSEVGKGSTFVVELPFEMGAAPEKSKKEEADKENSIHGLNLMLVEDNELNAEVAEILLEDEGAIITMVTDGQQAVELFNNNPEGTFDAILMDIMMPVMDGLTATKAIRALNRPDAGTIPIIAMTANAFAEDVQRCLDAGMNAHLAKPLDIEKVKKTICEHTIELYNKE